MGFELDLTDNEAPLSTDQALDAMLSSANGIMHIVLPIERRERDERRFDQASNRL